MTDPNTPPQDPYGQPPQNPYGQQPANPYGQAPQGAYGQPADPYGQPQNPYGQNPYGGAPGLGGPAVPYAHWGKRVGGYLIDGILSSLAAIPLWIGQGIAIAGASTTSTYNESTGMYEFNSDASGYSAIAILFVLIGVATSLAFFIWNTCIKQGRTGYSIGKGVMGIKLVSEQTGQPIGAGMSFVRQIAHILDSIACYIGWLWPLWDAKRQTFADKVMNTVVLDQPKG